jgi:hypothetical protein
MQHQSHDKNPSVAYLNSSATKVIMVQVTLFLCSHNYELATRMGGEVAVEVIYS